MGRVDVYTSQIAAIHAGFVGVFALQKLLAPTVAQTDFVVVAPRTASA